MLCFVTLPLYSLGVHMGSDFRRHILPAPLQQRLLSIAKNTKLKASSAYHLSWCQAHVRSTHAALFLLYGRDAAQRCFVECWGCVASCMGPCAGEGAASARATATQEAVRPGSAKVAPQSRQRQAKPVAITQALATRKPVDRSVEGSYSITMHFCHAWSRCCIANNVVLLATINSANVVLLHVQKVNLTS